MRLTDRTTDELTDGANFIRARGAADKDTWHGNVFLSFPVRDISGRAVLRGGGEYVARLAGSLAFTGAGPDVTWSSLRVSFARDVVTARINGGDRVAVLRTDDDRDGDRHHRAARTGGGDDSLRLTRAGARSLNVAADGTPFRAGQAFAGDSHGCD